MRDVMKDQPVQAPVKETYIAAQKKSEYIDGNMLAAREFQDSDVAQVWHDDLNLKTKLLI